MLPASFQNYSRRKWILFCLSAVVFLIAYIIFFAVLSLHIATKYVYPENIPSRKSIPRYRVWKTNPKDSWVQPGMDDIGPIPTVSNQSTPIEKPTPTLRRLLIKKNIKQGSPSDIIHVFIPVPDSDALLFAAPALINSIQINSPSTFFFHLLVPPLSPPPTPFESLSNAHHHQASSLNPSTSKVSSSLASKLPSTFLSKHLYPLHSCLNSSFSQQQFPDPNFSSSKNQKLKNQSPNLSVYCDTQLLIEGNSKDKSNGIESFSFPFNYYTFVNPSILSNLNDHNVHPPTTPNTAASTESSPSTSFEEILLRKLKSLQISTDLNDLPEDIKYIMHNDSTNWISDQNSLDILELNPRYALYHTQSLPTLLSFHPLPSSLPLYLLPSILPTPLPHFSLLLSPDSLILSNFLSTYHSNIAPDSESTSSPFPIKGYNLPNLYLSDKIKPCRQILTGHETLCQKKLVDPIFRIVNFKAWKLNEEKIIDKVKYWEVRNYGKGGKVIWKSGEEEEMMGELVFGSEEMWGKLSGGGVKRKGGRKEERPWRGGGGGGFEEGEEENEEVRKRREEWCKYYPEELRRKQEWSGAIVSCG
eukprot:TRINITY_DN2995_c0_g1_i1.p1 TRINITY_DN2995_c0_g1~~TRINITY_DN2995_c0_g1_i1.p1  ORF type:complete len:586 (+),score=129.92 TRINITY_DN2995_c0_g1_i1:55-1812(+)